MLFRSIPSLSSLLTIFPIVVLLSMEMTMTKVHAFFLQPTSSAAAATRHGPIMSTTSLTMVQQKKSNKDQQQQHQQEQLDQFGMTPETGFEMLFDHLQKDSEQFLKNQKSKEASDNWKELLTGLQKVKDEKKKIMKKKSNASDSNNNINDGDDDIDDNAKNVGPQP